MSPWRGLITSDKVSEIEKAYEATYITPEARASSKNRKFRPFLENFFKPEARAPITQDR
jgi:hypothetical protein